MDYGRNSNGLRLTNCIEFDRLNRQVVKALTDGKPPKVYIKEIAELEDLTFETLNKQKVTPKKMNATNAKGLNAMKQKVRKNNKEYATEIEKYRDDKGGYILDDEDEEEIVVEKKPKKAKSVAFESADTGDDEGYSKVGPGGKILQFTPESILRHLRTIAESRGKKNTDRAEQIRIMEKLLETAQTPYQSIRVLLTLVSTRFDLTSGSTSNYMSQEQWKM